MVSWWDGVSGIKTADLLNELGSKMVASSSLRRRIRRKKKATKAKRRATPMMAAATIPTIFPASELAPDGAGVAVFEGTVAAWAWSVGEVTGVLLVGEGSGVFTVGWVVVVVDVVDVEVVDEVVVVEVEVEVVDEVVLVDVVELVVTLLPFGSISGSPVVNGPIIGPVICVSGKTGSSVGVPWLVSQLKKLPSSDVCFSGEPNNWRARWAGMNV
jgi:hypothetical protein